MKNYIVNITDNVFEKMTKVGYFLGICEKIYLHLPAAAAISS